MYKRQIINNLLLELEKIKNSSEILVEELEGNGYYTEFETEIDKANENINEVKEVLKKYRGYFIPMK